MYIFAMFFPYIFVSTRYDRTRNSQELECLPCNALPFLYLFRGSPESSKQYGLVDKLNMISLLRYPGVALIFTLPRLKHPILQHLAWSWRLEFSLGLEKWFTHMISPKYTACLPILSPSAPQQPSRTQDITIQFLDSIGSNLFRRSGRDLIAMLFN